MLGAVNKDFFGMKNTPFVRGIPVNALYSDAETEEINARLIIANCVVIVRHGHVVVAGALVRRPDSSASA